MIAVDSIFMMPHLGVLSQLSEKAALDVFYNDCHVRLGTCIAPKGTAKKEGEKILDWKVVTPDGKEQTGELYSGDMVHIPFDAPEAKIIAKPAKGFDMGAGKGHEVEAHIEGGVVGLVFDGRGRPFSMPQNKEERIAKLKKWYTALDMYPAAAMDD